MFAVSLHSSQNDRWNPRPRCAEMVLLSFRRSKSQESPRTSLQSNEVADKYIPLAFKRLARFTSSRSIHFFRRIDFRPRIELLS